MLSFNKKIVFCPSGGLANRMRAFASCINLSIDVNAELDLVWLYNSECSSEFEKLFEIPQFSWLSNRKISAANFYLHPSNKFFFLRFLREYIFDIQIINLKNIELEVLNNFSKIYITNHHAFYEKYNLTQLFKPVREIDTIINQVVARFNSETIGMHIRRTDNLKAIRNNTIEQYDTYIRNSVLSNSQVNFFLATDDEQIKIHLLNQYPQNIIVYDSILSRNCQLGVKDAVIEMWCLSKTSKIIGSHYSSFSEIAAELGGINLIIL